MEQHASLTPHGELVNASIGPDGELIALWRTRSGAFRVTGSVELDLPNLDLAYPLVQPLSNGRVLLVGARARRNEKNAMVFDADGNLVADGAFGDGIEHVFTTSDDHAWVGYFDEGVFGDDGGPARHGLVRFDPAFQPDWHFPLHGLPPIYDCYALNVTDRAVWTSYYSDKFPLVQVKAGQTRSWRIDIEGARAVAVAGASVALFGGYGLDAERLAVGRLEGERLQVVEQHTLRLPVSGPSHVIGRGPDLHAITGRDWYRWSLA